MGFRDDREANVQRIEALERERDEVKRALGAAELRAAEVDDLRKSIASVTAERDALTRGAVPAKRGRRVVGTLATLSLFAVLLGVVAAREAAAFRREESLRREAESAQRLSEEATEQLRGQRDEARAELGQIDGVHTTELQTLEREVNVARLNEAGPALLILAHATSTQGAPPVPGRRCVMAIRDRPGGLCSVAVLCDGTQVFPFVEPVPNVRCDAVGGGRWTADGEVELAHASSTLASGTVLLRYDAAARTLMVRETAAPVFTLELAVADVVPFRLR